MKWLKRIQLGLAAASASTMVMIPVAQGAQKEASQKERIAEFLKITKFNSKKPLTVGEFHSRMRLWYPEAARQRLDVWATKYSDESMPKVDTSVIKDSNGQEQVRLLFSRGSDSFSITTGEDFIRVGQVKVTTADYYNIPQLVQRLQKEDPYFAKKAKENESVFSFEEVKRVVPTNKEFSRMTNQQRAEYLLNFRLALDAATQVIEIRQKADGKKKTAAVVQPGTEVLWAVLLRGEVACAAGLAGTPCISSGYMTKYDEKGNSCGGVTSGRADYADKINSSLAVFGGPKCQGGNAPSGPKSFACNPIVYGLASDGSAFCVPVNQMKYATRECNTMSPLDKGGQGYDTDRKRIVISWAKGLGAGLSDKDFEKKDGELRLKPEKFALIEGQLNDLNQQIAAAQNHCAAQPPREDQQSACDELLKRLFDLKKILCGKDNTSDACGAAVPIGPGGDTPQKKKGGMFPLLLLGGVLLLALLFKGKDKKVGVPVPVDPVPPPGTIEPPGPVDPPPPPPPPPVVVPPAEGGTGVAPDTSGGIR